MLICPVRDCRLALAREEKRLGCPQGHSFDVARSGYINLLQPQERRSKQPGDTPTAVEARQRLHDQGVTRPLLEAIGEVAPTWIKVGQILIHHNEFDRILENLSFTAPSEIWKLRDPGDMVGTDQLVRLISASAQTLAMAT